MCLQNKKIKHAIASIDIFEVDSVQIQYEKASTKSLFGGILTLIIPISCIIAFVLLFLSNQTKPTITTQTLSNTNNKLSSSLQATIEWNKDLVDVTTINPIQIITKEGKTSTCFKNKGLFTVNEMPLCDFSNDLIGEPNGLGYVFKLKSPNKILPVLPFKTSDIIAFHEKDQATYILHVLDNKFCIYKPTLNYTDSFCVPYKVIINGYFLQFTRYIYRNGNDVYCSVDNNAGTLYLFKNHKLVSMRQCTADCPLMYLSENMMAQRVSASVWYLITTNGSITVTREPYPKNTFMSTFSITFEKIIIAYLSAGPTPRSFLLTLFTYTFANNTKDSIVVPPLQFDFSNLQVEMRVIDNSLFTMFYSNGKCKTCYTHICVLHIITKNLTCKTFFANYTNNHNEIRRVSVLPRYETNSGYIADQEVEEDVITIKQFLVFDASLQEDYLDDPTNADNSLVSKIFSVHKYQKNYWLTFTVSYFPSTYNNFESVTNFGGIMECSPRTENEKSACFPLYSNSFTIQPEPYIDMNAIVAKIQVGATEIKVKVEDVISQKDFQNSYRVNNLRLSNVDEVFQIGKHLKTLYSISLESQYIINGSNVPFSTYFKVENSKSGYDKKFSCLAVPYINYIDTLGTIFPINGVNCAPPIIQNLPFIFDNSFTVVSGGIKGNYVDSTNLTGVFLVHLDPVIIETTVVSTKAELTTIFANVMSVFTTLLTVFMTIKKFAYKKDNKDELAKKMLELAPSETFDTFEGKIITTDNKMEINKKLSSLRAQNIV